MKKVIGAQGEITIIKIDALPDGMQTKSVERIAGGFIISHSERGHHHLLTGGGVMERTDNIPAGMAKIYAILEKPEELVQDAATPHGKHKLDPGIYEFRIGREHDHFLALARRVAD